MADAPTIPQRPNSIIYPKGRKWIPPLRDDADCDNALTCTSTTRNQIISIRDLGFKPYTQYNRYNGVDER